MYVLPAEENAGKVVKGWFPRASIHPVSIQYTPNDLPYDSQASDTQVSSHSDSQYSQLSESEQESAAERKAKKVHVNDSSEVKSKAAKGKRSAKREGGVSVKGMSKKEISDLQKMAASGSPPVTTRRRKK